MTETVEQTVESAMQNPEVISTSYIVISIITMALVTYLVRMLPFAAIRRKVKSQF
jgi:hypothetical protein